MASIFDLEEYRFYRSGFISQRVEFSIRLSYLDGSRYSSALNAMSWLAPRVAAEIRPLYLPCVRAVNVDAGIVPGFPERWAFAPDVPPSVVAQASSILRASRWDSESPLWISRAASVGEGVLRVSLSSSGVPVIQSVDPAAHYVGPDGLEFLVRDLKTVNGVIEYAEVVSDEWVLYFRDGVLHSRVRNGLRASHFVRHRHIDNGRAYGDCAFFVAMSLLDEVNRIATDIASLIHQHKDPQWGVIGAEGGVDLKRGGDNVWFIPQGGDFKVLVPGVDIPGFLEFLREIASQVEKSMPELAFDELTSKELVATPTVELQLLELVLLVRRLRPLYDDALTRALVLAARLAPSGFSELAGFDGQLFDQQRAVLPTDLGAKLDLEIKRLQLERVRVAIDAGKVDLPVSEPAKPSASGLSVMT